MQVSEHVSYSSSSPDASSSRMTDDHVVGESERHYRLLAENTKDVVIWSYLDTTRRYVSPASRAVLGYEPEELVGTRPLDFVHPEDAPAYADVLDDLRHTRIDQAVTCQRYRRKDGAWIWIEASFSLTHDEASGRADGYVASLRDISDRKAAEDALRVSEERLSLALDSGSDGLWDFDLGTGAVHLSGDWLSIIGYEEGEVEPHMTAWQGLTHWEDAARSRALLAQHVKGLTAKFECEYRIRRKDGGYVWTLARGKVVARDAQGRARRMVGTHIDITSRKEAERLIEHMALHDALTGLPNRTLLGDRLQQQISVLERHERSFAVLVCDLDRFKYVNDLFGHSAGDATLRAVAERLTAVTREGDTVARMGGDEFAIVLAGLDHPQEAGLIARSVIEAVSRPIVIEGREANVGVSLGIVIGPQDGRDADHLLKNADIALYRAKTEGRNTFRFFESGMDAQVARRDTLERDMRQAVQQGGFELNYQPVMDVTSGAPTCFEALLRWPHPNRGNIPPSEFISLAEETGLIVGLGDWVLREACRMAGRWTNDEIVAVNVSAVQFRQPGRLEQSVLSALAESQLAPKRLELEITESVLVQDAEAVISCLIRLRTLGVRVALDDFGTGYSSLAYLRRFPFCKIKIDRAFVRDIADPGTAAIVRAVVGLALRVGAEVTAEGVETERQRELVCREGCTQIQGFLFSKPLSGEDAVEFSRLEGGRGRRRDQLRLPARFAS